MHTITQSPLEWSPLWDAMKAAPSEWFTTTESMYWDMLEAVPPAAMSNGAFLVGEAERHNEQGEAVYACFKKRGETFTARYMTLREFKA